MRDNNKLPFSIISTVETAPESKMTVYSVMSEVRNMMNAALDNLNLDGYFSEINKLAMQFALNAFNNAFESRYAELKEASGGYLDPAWMKVVNLAKGLYYQLAFGKAVTGGWTPLSEDEFEQSVKELNYHVGQLQASNNPFSSESGA